MQQEIKERLMENFTPNEMFEIYANQLGLLASIMFDMDNVAEVVIEMAKKGEISWAEAEVLPLKVTAALSIMADILGRDLNADLESFREIYEEG